MLTHVALVSENRIGTHLPFITIPVSVIIGFYGTMRIGLGEDIKVCEDDKNSTDLHSIVVVRKHSGLWKDQQEIALRAYPGEAIEVVDVKLNHIELNHCEIHRAYQFAEGQACLGYTLDLFYYHDGIYKTHHTPNLSTCCRHSFNNQPIPGSRLIFTYQYKIMNVKVNRQDTWCHLNHRVI